MPEPCKERDTWKKEKELETVVLLGTPLCDHRWYQDGQRGQRAQPTSWIPQLWLSLWYQWLGTREVQDQIAVTSRKGTTKAPSWKCSQSIKLSKSQHCCCQDIAGAGEMVLAWLWHSFPIFLESRDTFVILHALGGFVGGHSWRKMELEEEKNRCQVLVEWAVFESHRIYFPRTPRKVWSEEIGGPVLTGQGRVK